MCYISIQELNEKCSKEEAVHRDASGDKEETFNKARIVYAEYTSEPNASWVE